MMEKQALRTKIRTLNPSFLIGDYPLQASREICLQLWQHPIIQKATHIALYHSLPDEPSLAPLISKLSENKKIYLPRVEENDIAFYLYEEEQLLSKGSFGIEEPTSPRHCAVDPLLLEVIIVPGMAFTPQGKRLGRGKAFYDRFLPKSPSAYKIGVTFGYRLLSHIPTNPWDITMNEVITDKLKEKKIMNEAKTITLSATLPEYPAFREGIRRAPDRGFKLNKNQTRIALKNALRYVPKELHEKLAPEFLEELKTRGKIYAYRYRPEGDLKAKSIDDYKGKCIEGKAFQVMIQNNLSDAVALYPYELVTYGETGQVCQNWLQYRLITRYLEEMEQDQTLVIESGHPLGLFKSRVDAPRVIITNSMMIGIYDNIKDWEIAAQMGVANYGQMTAGGWMYIGPQGIVHGTFNTLLNAGRLELNIPKGENLKGKLFVSSGLGGMSGAQPKAADIAGAVSITAEVDFSRIQTRLDQGWVKYADSNLENCIKIAQEKQKAGEPYSIAYHGNIVDLLEYCIAHDVKIDLLSDQTSCHAAYEGGYCPVTLTFEERTKLLKEDRERFRQEVDKGLRKHYEAIKKLVDKGVFFFDYGNSFLKALFDAGITEISKNGKDDKDGFIWPSYVENILGPELFDYGYGPFRWVCLSNKPEDLKKTDLAAMECIDPNRREQDRDNYIWIKDAEKNALVVGTQARILYQDAEGRLRIALKFNEMVRNGEVGPIMLGRDHHDTAGTDSPFRETANIKDGSNVMADMAVQCYAGNAARGMSLVALHNGGGTGIGKAINGGFGMVLDGSERVDNILRTAMLWDVIGGVARRSWARNPHAMETSELFNREHADGYHITIPYLADDELIEKLIP